MKKMYVLLVLTLVFLVGCAGSKPKIVKYEDSIRGCAALMELPATREAIKIPMAEYRYNDGKVLMVCECKETIVCGDGVDYCSTAVCPDGSLHPLIIVD